MTKKPYNILFILTDQERHFDSYDFPVPARERLRKEGVTFANHQITSCVCSPSRSVIYTGQHVQHTQVWDNVSMPWQRDLPKDLPTIGLMMQQAGYHAVYLGKWHLSNSMHFNHSPFDADPQAMNAEMARYGFDDYFGLGDLIGGVHGGFEFDGVTTENAVSWLRHWVNTTHNTNAKHYNSPEMKKPWFLAVNIVNPHDVMFTNTDSIHALDDINQTNDKKMLLGNGKPPKHKLYEMTWTNVPLDPTRHQPYDEAGRPHAHSVFYHGRGNLVGQFPVNDERLRIYQDNYFNCIRDSDRHVARLIQELEDLDLLDNTIIVMTSDHGDHVGAHQLVGKGATVYREQVNVPFIIRHPDYLQSAGKVCQALTCHLDIVPTLLSFTGVDEKQLSAIQGDSIKGKNLTPLLSAPDNAKLNAVRTGTLYSYGMMLYFDSDWVLTELTLLRRSGLPEPQLQQRVMANQPDFDLRGMIRMVNNGKYKFSRYFSPLNFNTPTTLEELFANNDVELYDLVNDPQEMNNLAKHPELHADILLQMNAQLNALIVEEVGIDDARTLPIKDNKIWIEQYDKQNGLTDPSLQTV